MMRLFISFVMILFLVSSLFSIELVETLKFVVIPEKGFETDEYTLFTINSINEKLSDSSIEYVESDVISKLRKKLEKVYEEKKGESMSFSQLLASEAGGNIYVEVSTKVEDKKMDSLKQSYSGVSSVDVRQVYIRITISVYDVSTGRGLGKSIVSTNVPIAGSTSEKVEKFISKLSSDAFDEVIKKINKYLEGGKVISLKFIGIKDLAIERDVSTMVDGIPVVKVKKRKSMSDGYVEYDVVIKGTTDEFVDSLRDSLETVINSKFDIDVSQNMVIVKIK